MDDKQKIREKVLPKAVLQAMTPEALEAIPQGQRVDEYVVIRCFPFRIGRESRLRRVDGRVERVERPKRAEREPNNDLYLLDKGKLLNISREHLRIEKTADGYMLVDRGSACGTRIEGQVLGGEDAGGQRVLQDGDVVALGTATTPYRYRFVALEDETAAPG